MNKRKHLIILTVFIVFVLLFIKQFGITTKISKIANSLNKAAETSVRKGEYVELELNADTKDQTKTDENTMKLQNAVNQISEAGGGIIYIPEGTYYFTGERRNKASNYVEGTNEAYRDWYIIECKDNVTIQGAGMNETILRPYGHQSGGIDMFYYNKIRELGAQPKYLVNADFKDFTINGEEAECYYLDDNGERIYHYTTSGKGFMINLFKDCDWENVAVLLTDGTGFGMDCPINCTVTNCIADGCGKGILYDIRYNSNPSSAGGGSGFGIGTGYSDDEYIHIKDSEAKNNVKFGFFFEHQTTWESGANTYTAQKSRGFVVSNSTAKDNMYDFGGFRGDDISIENCVSESTNPGTAIHFDNHTRRVHVVGTQINKEFTDIPNTDINYEAIKWALNKGITNGVTETTFGNDTNTFTRAQAIVYLFRYDDCDIQGMPLYRESYSGFEVTREDGTKIEECFEDVSPTSSYADAVCWGLDKEIVTGVGGKFLPNNACTKGMFLTFLYRYHGSPEVDIQKEYSTIQTFNIAANWAVNNGLITLPTDLTEAQNDIASNISRGDALGILYKYYKNIQNRFRITYNLNNDADTSMPTEYKSTTFQDFTLVPPVKSGYTFKGWTGSNGSAIQTTVNGINGTKGNLVYTANWEINSYTVRFNGNGGTASEAERLVEYNSIIGTLPDATRTGYTFDGWYTDANGGTQIDNKTIVTKNINYYAHWTPIEYTVTFKDEDGTVLSTKQYDYGTAASSIEKPANPTKPETNQYTYTFNKWTPDITDVTENATYTAIYTRIEKKYNVVYDANGGELPGYISSPQTVLYSTVFYIENPTKNNSTFKGWKLQGTLSEEAVYGDSESCSTPIPKSKICFLEGKEETYFSKLNSNEGTITLLAQWEDEGIEKYTVTFKDEDGTVLSTKQYDYGTAASSIEKPANPTKEATAQYTYTFEKWTPDITDVTENATYTAQYKSTVNKYTVTFKDEDGTVLSTKQYDYGTAASSIEKPANPTKPETNQYKYTFNKWTPDITDVTENATYTAIYTRIEKKYNVVYDANGGELPGYISSPQTVLYSTVFYIENPTKNNSTFKGWKLQGTLSEEAVYGDSESCSTPIPKSKICFLEGKEETYFSKLNSNEGTITLLAQWEDEGIEKYTVTFKDEDGTVLSTKQYDYGTAASSIEKPANPTKEATAQYTYTFEKWTPDITDVTENATYTAQYKSTVNKYTVTFKDEDGTVLSTKQYDYGTAASSIEKPANPTKEATAQYTYTFEKWTPDITDVTGNTTYTAQYKSTVNKYTVTFNGNEGTPSENSRQVEYGSQIGALPTATRTGYIFDGWYTDLTNGEIIDENITITENVEFYAHWTIDESMYCTITFDGVGGSPEKATIKILKNTKIGRLPKLKNKPGIFRGWYTSPVGGQKVNSNTTISQDITLYAQYFKIGIIGKSITGKTTKTYIVAFHANGGRSSEYTRSIEKGSAVGTLPTATREGYVFDGWYTSKIGGKKVESNDIIKNRKTLYAHWIKE